jgi:hypothetical protein
MHAKDHKSAEVLYFEPSKTSGPLYWRVCIYVAKWWCIQQALPRSAIFTLKPFSSFGPLSKTSLVSKALNNSFIEISFFYVFCWLTSIYGFYYIFFFSWIVLWIWRSFSSYFFSFFLYVFFWFLFKDLSSRVYLILDIFVLIDENY